MADCRWTADSQSINNFYINDNCLLVLQMPSTVLDLLESNSLELTGSVRWNEPVQCKEKGIYIVSLSRNPEENGGVLNSAPLEIKTIEKWLQQCNLELKDDPTPSTEAIEQRIGEFWLPDENILYIGQTSHQDLNTRIDQLYKHKLGKSSPHRGGHWLKTLSNLKSTFVHYAETVDRNPKDVKSSLIEDFVDRVSSSTTNIVSDPERPYPFANLDGTFKGRKCHGIRMSIRKIFEQSNKISKSDNNALRMPKY